MKYLFYEIRIANKLDDSTRSEFGVISNTDANAIAYMDDIIQYDPSIDLCAWSGEYIESIKQVKPVDLSTCVHSAREVINSGIEVKNPLAK